MIYYDGCVKKMDQELRKAELFKIVEKYFRQKNNIDFQKDVELKGSTKKWKLDLVVQTEDGAKFGVVVKDWARTLGVNQVRQLQKACYDIPLDGGILVSNAFSPSALSFGERYGISCFSRYEILSKI